MRGFFISVIATVFDTIVFTFCYSYYFNFIKASLNFPIISPISSFLQVPTLNLYQDDFLSAPKQ